MTIALAGLLAACGANGGEGDGADTPAAREVSAQAGADAGEQAVSGEEVVILAFGDSLFAGYGLQDSEGYPEQLQATLRGQGINARVIDAGVSGDTTGAGAQRIAFVLDNQPAKPNLALVGLGGNDLLRGLPVDGARTNLEKILLELQDRGIPVLLFGMRAPPNAGPDYVEAFDGLYPQLAEKYGAALIPFWLEPVYDQPQLMQADRIHPTARGIEALVAYTEDDVREALPAAD
ncbi:arylesterase [Paraurantiacibacter namhicola]|nr:arylesterase [Paraurantiacibacter namhicola]